MPHAKKGCRRRRSRRKFNWGDRVQYLKGSLYKIDRKMYLEVERNFKKMFASPWFISKFSKKSF